MTQFYVEQMMDSGMFEKLGLKDREKKPEVDRTFANATDYFEEIISNNETYKSNAGRTATRAGFESAIQVKDAERPDADTGDDIHSYYKDLAASSSADKEIIQQMQQKSPGMISMNMEMQKAIAAQSAQMKEMQEMMKAM